MFNFNGMSYKRSGRAGGKSVSMVGMLVLLLAALLVLPSCFDDDEERVEVPGPTVEVPGPTVYVCPDGSEEDSADDCETPTTPMDMYDKVLSDKGEEFQGGSLDEVISGGAGDDTIRGAGGDDVLHGKGGKDKLYGDDDRDTLDGGDEADMLFGGADDDTLVGGAGDDMLEGGGGDDMIDGGEGMDTASYADSPGGVEVSLAENKRSVHDAARDELSNIENLAGSRYDDTLTGDEGPNVFVGTAGNDTIDGEGESDTVSYAAFASNVRVVVDLNVDATTAPPTPSASYTIAMDLNDDGDTVDDGESNAYVDTFVTVDHDDDPDTAKISTIENVVAGKGGSDIEGDGQDNTLSGGAGLDEIDGGPGEDVISGGADAEIDVLMGGPAPSDDTEGPDDGDDVIFAMPGDTVNGGDHDNDKSKKIEPGGNGDTVDYGRFYIKKAPDTQVGLGTADSRAALPTEIEILLGTRYIDYVDTSSSAGERVIVISREGNDDLMGGAGNDVLIGCSGTNSLDGDGSTDVFGVVKGGIAKIADFQIGEDGDEIHYKGFAEGDYSKSDVSVQDASGSVLILVKGVKVAEVTPDAMGDTAVTDLVEDLADRSKSHFFDYNFPADVMCTSPDV